MSVSPVFEKPESAAAVLSCDDNRLALDRMVRHGVSLLCATCGCIRRPLSVHEDIVYAFHYEAVFSGFTCQSKRTIERSHALDRIDLFRIFVRVVECASFTRAADTLGLPRSSVSAAVLELERRVGARLLHRTTRKVSPT